VTTNRKGRATFNVTRSLRKAAEADGSESSGGEDVSSVEIVKEGTDDCVLEGGVDKDAFENISFGFADYGNEAGDSASVSMFSAPGFGDESFNVTLFPIQESFAAAYFDLYRDTAQGDELPLGVDSVNELAGRAFQILTPEGTVLIEGDLPLLEDADFGWDDSWGGEKPGEGDRLADPASGIWAGPNGDWWDGGEWDGSWDKPDSSDDGSEDDWSWSDDWSKEDLNFFDAAGARPGTTKSAKSHRGVKEDPATDEPSDDEPVSGYTLRIADGNGDFQDAGVFQQILLDHPIECPWNGDDFDFGDGAIIGIVFVAFDEIDWEGTLDEILGELDFGDWSDWGGEDDGVEGILSKLGFR
jgi:hypothetical protein